MAKLRKAVLLGVLWALLALPSQALALGSEVVEPNWRLWVVAIVAGIILAVLMGTGIYVMWLRRMRASTARLWSFVMIFLMALLFAMGGYIWFVGPVSDLIAYLLAGAFALLAIFVTAFGRRRTA